MQNKKDSDRKGCAPSNPLWLVGMSN